MRVSIYQPLYWPPLHYFNRMLDVDVFVLLDSAQFTRSARYRNTMTIKGRSGISTMAVPIVHTGKRERIMDLRIDNGRPWRRKHYGALRHSYGKTEAWKSKEGEFLKQFYYGVEPPQERFQELYEPALDWTVEMIGGWGRTAKVRSSELDVEGNNDPSGWMLDICKHFGADEYLCGGGAAEYLDEKAFETAGVRVIIQDWTCLEYRQQGKGFLPNLSILDLIMNVGEKDRRALLL